VPFVDGTEADWVVRRQLDRLLEALDRLAQVALAAFRLSASRLNPNSDFVRVIALSGREYVTVGQ